MHPYTHIDGHGLEGFVAVIAVYNVVAHVKFGLEVFDGGGGEDAREPGVRVLMGGGAVDVGEGGIVVVLGGGGELFESVGGGIESHIREVVTSHGLKVMWKVG